MQELIEQAIEQAWLQKDSLSEGNPQILNAIEEVLEALDQGNLRIAEKHSEGWHVNTWIKKAVLLSFLLKPNQMMDFQFPAYDKIPLKFKDWSQQDFHNSRIRAVPGSIVRYGAYVAPDVVLMPSFINIGAYVGQGTLVDTWATIGSCAQVGKNCHISGGVGLGGVLEPIQARPVIIEDNCFIGARSEIVEGIVVETGAVLSMGVFIGLSTPIVDRMTGEIFFGRVPSYSVVIPGSLPGKELPNGQAGPALSCAVIVKKVDARTRSKTSINELLRPQA